jgi:hypothetical protein
LPVGGQSRDALWDVEAAVEGEASQDGLYRAGRGRHQHSFWVVKRAKVGLTSSKESRSDPPRVEKYFIEYQHNLFGFKTQR